MTPMETWGDPSDNIRHVFEGFDDGRLLHKSEQIQHLAMSNDVLDSSQRMTLAQDVSTLENHVQLLKDLEEYIPERRAHAQQCLQWHRCALSPIRSLSSDVLAEIFKFSVQLDQPQIMGFTKQHFCYPHTSLPRTLSQVCRHWRAIAVSTSALWTNFTIDLEKGVEFRHKKYRDSIQMWLERAGTQPITLRLVFDSNDDDDASGSAEDSIDSDDEAGTDGAVQKYDDKPQMRRYSGLVASLLASLCYKDCQNLSLVF
jgi:hypothetical protein